MTVCIQWDGILSSTGWSLVGGFALCVSLVIGPICPIGPIVLPMATKSTK